jgi:hypothetical protein
MVLELLALRSPDSAAIPSAVGAPHIVNPTKKINSRMPIFFIFFVPEESCLDLDVVGQVVIHLRPGDGSTWRRGLALQVHGITKSDSVLARLDFDVGARARPDLDGVVSGSCRISGLELGSRILFEELDTQKST